MNTSAMNKMKIRKNTFLWHNDGGDLDDDDDYDVDDEYDLCQGGCLGVFDEICCEVKLAHQHCQNLFFFLNMIMLMESS